MEEKREQFTFYRSFFDAVRLLPQQWQLELLMAVIAFALDGTEPEGLNDMQRGQFLLIRPVLAAARKKALGGRLGKRSGNKNNKGEKEREAEKENEIEKEREVENKRYGFRHFWERYPVKLGREDARQAWKCACEEENQDEIFQGLERWLVSSQWRAEGGRYVPKPAKWLREGWWRQAPAADSGVVMASAGLGQAELEAIRDMLDHGQWTIDN